MCFGSKPAAAATTQKKKVEFDDAPPVVTGEQEGVENPFDTKKITDQLKLRRKKKEKGIKIKKGDPDLSNVRIAGLNPEVDTRKKSGMGSTSSPYNTKSIY
tara:strand:+ start:1169 stop:1471 length:303 start_codon:yes stop_codon:yes gene_type:complete